MKAVLIVLIVALFFSSCLRVDPMLTGTDVVISGRLTFNCNDSTPMKNIGLVLSGRTQNASCTTDSNGRFTFKLKGSGNEVEFQRAIDGASLFTIIPLKNHELGDVFYKPCIKVVLHYDTVGHTLNLNEPFFVQFNSTNDQISKRNLQSLAKPDSLYWRGFTFYGTTDFPDFNYGPYLNTRTGKLNTPLLQSYEWQHVVTKVP